MFSYKCGNNSYLAPVFIKDNRFGTHFLEHNITVPIISVAFNIASGVKLCNIKSEPQIIIVKLKKLSGHSELVVAPKIEPKEITTFAKRSTRGYLNRVIEGAELTKSNVIKLVINWCEEKRYFELLTAYWCHPSQYTLSGNGIYLPTTKGAEDWSEMAFVYQHNYGQIVYTSLYLVQQELRERREKLIKARLCK